jgi:hypothetical protein
MPAKRGSVLLVARSTFAVDIDGQTTIVAEGTRLPSTDPVVKAHADWFAPADPDPKKAA